VSGHSDRSRLLVSSLDDLTACLGSCPTSTNPDNPLQKGKAASFASSEWGPFGPFPPVSQTATALENLWESLAADSRWIPDPAPRNDPAFAILQCSSRATAPSEKRLHGQTVRSLRQENRSIRRIHVTLITSGPAVRAELQTVRAMVGGGVRRMRVCTRRIRSNKSTRRLADRWPSSRPVSTLTPRGDRTLFTGHQGGHFLFVSGQIPSTLRPVSSRRQRSRSTHRVFKIWEPSSPPRGVFRRCGGKPRCTSRICPTSPPMNGGGTAAISRRRPRHAPDHQRGLHLAQMQVAMLDRGACRGRRRE